ncbi:hypothetical protein HYV84_03995 [Candidatus Woesearchaeota archaeon]|nr:hypothetical protein [Candidatus Woesearchaeota archaeon]
MGWNNLAGINSISLPDLHEYHSRPTQQVVDFIRSVDKPIIIWGASGKFMGDVTEMVLRVIQDSDQKGEIHLVKSPRSDTPFHERIKPYSFATLHEIDLMRATHQSFDSIPREGTVLYGAGNKFRKKDSSGQEEPLDAYIEKCQLFGVKIPDLVFHHHQYGCRIVVMGSFNGLKPSTVLQQALDDAVLEPTDTNYYGQSIKWKEETIKAVLEGAEGQSPSKAIILRGGWFTDGTYGGG